MKKLLTLIALWGVLLPVGAQQFLSLDSCRAMALRNNKPLNVSKLKQEVAFNVRKAARTKYLPKVDAVGGYQYFNREISLLSNQQKTALDNLGTNAVTNISSSAPDLLTSLVQQGLLTQETAQQLSNLLTGYAPSLSSMGNQQGNEIKDALRTDTRNLWSGAIMVRQPLYMGGAIIAANKIADINEQMAANDFDLKTQTTLYDTDQAYWTVVSLKQKQALAYSYRTLVKKLNEDVHKMIRQGVATKAEGLKVDVKVNEADMQVTQVDDGLSLARMYLCQLCGLPLDMNIRLADEDRHSLNTDRESFSSTVDSSFTTRPEVRMLQNAVDASKQNTKLIRAEYLPHVALTGGYLLSNPNLFNGFERRFSGVWNIGVTVQVPVWNWSEGIYKVRASKAATTITEMELQDAREKIQLQISQSQFKVREAQKRLAMATQNIQSAEENLRCANLGFKEGIMNATDVMTAQTAWQEAQSQKIDAEIDVKISQAGLQKALGILQ